MADQGTVDPGSDREWQKKYGDLPLGALVGPGWRVEFDWQDLMWAVRAVIGESGHDGTDWELADTEAVLWSMANLLWIQRDINFGRGPAAHRPPHRYYDLLIAYCQPINPYQRYLDPDKIALREKYASIGPTHPWVHPRLLERVIWFMRGWVPRGPYWKLRDFLACGEVSGHGPVLMAYENCFYGETVDPPKLTPDTPHIEFGYMTRARKSVAAAGVLVASAFSGLLWWARR